MSGREPAAKFLLIGGQEPLGCWIARRLVEEGTPVVLCDRRPRNEVLRQVLEPESLGLLERAFLDPAHPGALERVIRERLISRVIHLGTGEAPPAADAAILAAAAGAGAAPLVYASTKEREPAARETFEERGLTSIGLWTGALYGVGIAEGPGAGPTRAIRAAVLGRRFTLQGGGAIGLLHAGDAARILIAAARAGAAAALSFRIPSPLVAMEDFILEIEREVPGSAGRIDCAGEAHEVPVEMEEAGLEDLLGAEALVPRPLAEGIRLTAEMFRRLAEEGRLDETG